MYWIHPNLPVSDYSPELLMTVGQGKAEAVL